METENLHLMCAGSYSFGTVSALTINSAYRYEGQGEPSLQKLCAFSPDVERQGDSRRWPDLVHDVNGVIPQYLYPLRGRIYVTEYSGLFFRVASVLLH